MRHGTRYWHSRVVALGSFLADYSPEPGNQYGILTQHKRRARDRGEGRWEEGAVKGRRESITNDRILI